MQSNSSEKATIILPMRDEENHVKRKIFEVIEEIGEKGDVDVIVINSASVDDTSRIATNILSDSCLREKRWKVIDSKKSGKSHAINLALSETNSDLYIVMDADVTAVEGWMDKLSSYFANPEIGAISGVEGAQNAKKGGIRDNYRNNSDKIKLWESYKDSTPVLEGALMAWRKSALGDFELDEGCNADDAQISFQAIRRGFRSVVVNDLVFFDMNNNHKWNSRSIRRSQGISRVLIKNSDLIFTAKRQKVRPIIFYSVISYVIFPWTFTSFVMTSSIMALERQFWSNDLFLPFLLMLTISVSIPIVRALLWGVSISLIAHAQFFLGKRYSNWDTSREQTR